MTLLQSAPKLSQRYIYPRPHLHTHLPLGKVKLARLGKVNSPWTSTAEMMMAETDGEILTLDEVAAFLKVSKRTIYRLVQRGEIPAFKIGGTWRFRRSELDRWIADSINKI